MRRVCLIVACCCLALSAASAEPRGRALIVGVNDYTDANITDLRYSVADAKLLAGLITDPQRGIFPADQVRLLTDESPDESKPGRAAILEGLEWLAGAAPDEAVLFYFSGHGMVDDKNRHYLVSRDVRMASLATSAVPVSLVNEILDDAAKTKARQVVVVLDSCHSGVRRGARDGTSESGQIIEGLLSEAEGRVTFSSCAADEQSFEDAEKGHGVFTYYLAQGLRGLADANSDGLVGVGELHVYVRNEVCDWAKAHGNRQTPRVQSNVSGEIILAKDPARWEAASQAKSQRRAELSQLRDRLLGAIGGGADAVPIEEGAVLLRAVDRAVGEKPLAGDEKLVALVERFGRGELKPAALRAEIRAVPGVDAPPPTAAAAPNPVKLQLFQPEWESGATEDELVIACAPGEEIRVVGLADSPHGITRVMLDDQVLSAGSLVSQTLQVVAMAAQARGVVPRAKEGLRFQGSLRAGNVPVTAVLKAMDATGNTRLLRLSVRPRAGGAAPAATVAVVGLSRRAVDEYEELRALRVGQGLDKMLGQVARDTGRYRLVEEKAEVLKGLVERQHMQTAPEFDPGTAVQVGKLLGARYVLYGEVYDFASPKENRGQLFMGVQVRLVDVETAAYRPGNGEASLKVPPGEAGEAEFDRTTLGKVSRQAIQAALEDLFGKG